MDSDRLRASRQTATDVFREQRQKVTADPDMSIPELLRAAQEVYLLYLPLVNDTIRKAGRSGGGIRPLHEAVSTASQLMETILAAATDSADTALARTLAMKKLNVSSVSNLPSEDIHVAISNFVRNNMRTLVIELIDDAMDTLVVAIPNVCDRFGGSVSMVR